MDGLIATIFELQNNNQVVDNQIGNIAFVYMDFIDPVEKFIQTFRTFHKTHCKKNFVIVFDGPMFDTESNGFDFF